MIVGIYSGALTSTPAFSAAKSTADTKYESAVTVGHGIAYLFGVIGVVLYVQFIPKIVGANMEIERALMGGGEYEKRIGTERTDIALLPAINRRLLRKRRLICKGRNGKVLTICDKLPEFFYGYAIVW